MNGIFYYKKTEKTSIDDCSDEKRCRLFKSGYDREKIFYDLMLKSGFVLDVNETALMKENIGYENRRIPESCREKFDFSLELNKCRVYFEVSGTDSSNVNKSSDLYIRIDKLDFLSKHEGICYFVHILNNDKESLIRVIKLNDLDKSDYFVKQNYMYTFYAVHYNNSKVMSFDEFLVKLKSEFF
jgi:hypothetical protein